MRKLILAALAALAICGQAQAGYVYVGTWDVNSGPNWPSEPVQYTGQEAAALLFGGSAAGYAISTRGTDASLIDFSNWVSGWGMGHTGDIVAENVKIDLDGDGLYNTLGETSAFVRDWCFSGTCINYAFRITDSNVPEPASAALAGLGILGLALGRRRRASK